MKKDTAKRQAKHVQALKVAKAAEAVRRKTKLFDDCWKLYKERMDALQPGWDSNKLFVAKARATLRQEVDAKFHSDLVVVPNLS